MLCLSYRTILFYSDQPMSLEKFKKGTSDQLALLKTKLVTVDTHIRRSENLPATLFMHPELIQFLTREPQIIQISNEIGLKKPKSYLFNQSPVIRCFFLSQPLSEDRRFILKVQPIKTRLEVLVQLDSQRKVGYFVKDTKGILINETGWKRAEFTIIAKSKEKLSMAKVQMDTFIIEHKTNAFGIGSHKKEIHREMKQFLKNNLTKQKIAAIMEKRRRKSLLLTGGSMRSNTFSAQSTAKSKESHQTSRMFRSLSGFNQSTSMIKNRSPVYREQRIQSTQMKKDLHQFEQSKQKYLKHIERMEPEIAQEIMQSRKKYLRSKEQTLESVCTMISSIVFMQKLLKVSRRVSKQKCKKMQAELLCQKFYKNLVHANKMRLAFRTRNKLAMDLNLGVISCCLWKESRRKAEERLVSKFKDDLFKLDVQKIAAKCQVYQKSAIKIQRMFRRDNQFYRFRFEIMVKGIKDYTFASEQEFQQLFRTYKAYCYSKSKMLKYGFTKYHRHIDDLMKQKLLKQIRL